MKIKRFVAKDIRQAMKMVKDELGADAVIMSNKSVDEGVEIVAARDFDEEAVQNQLKLQTTPNRPYKAKKKIELADFDLEKDNLHIVSSARKVGDDGAIPKRPVRRHVDQYVGYAEKLSLTSANNKPAKNKPKRTIQKPVVPAKQFSFDAMKEDQPESTVSQQFMEEMRDEIKSLKAVFNTKLSEMSWAKEVQNNPVRAELLHRLAEMGISKKLSIKLANRLDSHKDLPLAFEKDQDM
jgi:flagellar biosynthesis protein FlhF